MPEIAIPVNNTPPILNNAETFTDRSSYTYGEVSGSEKGLARASENSNNEMNISECKPSESIDELKKWLLENSAASHSDIIDNRITYNKTVLSTIENLDKIGNMSDEELALTILSRDHLMADLVKCNNHEESNYHKEQLSEIGKNISGEKIEAAFANSKNLLQSYYGNNDQIPRICIESGSI